jgi:hypothetical protein
MDEPTVAHELGYKDLEYLQGRYVYLASPYSDPSRIIMKKRFEQICFHAGTLLNVEAIVFCAIAHTHPICVCNELPRGYDYWEKFDRAFVKWCEVFLICGMDGWEKSDGVNREFKLATELGKERLLWNLDTGLLGPISQIIKDEDIPDSVASH